MRSCFDTRKEGAMKKDGHRRPDDFECVSSPDMDLFVD
jgi:hypothetical protein